MSSQVETRRRRDFQRTLFMTFSPVILVLIVISTLFFGLTGATTQAILHGVSALVFAASLWLVWRRPRYTPWGLNLFSLMGIAVLLPIQFGGQAGEVGLMWYGVYGVMVVALLGIGWGSIWAGALYGASLLLFVLQETNVLEKHFDTLLMAQFYFASAILYVFILLFIYVRKNLETELDLERARLENAQAVARIGTWQWDVVRDRVKLSPEIRHLLGIKNYRERDLKAYISSVHKLDQSAVQDAIRSSIASGDPFSVDFRIETVGGQEIWLHSEGRPVYDDGKRPQVVLGTVQDITDKKIIELHLVRQNKHLKQVEKIMVSRELRMIELKKQVEALQGRKKLL